jgi:hypothetical protein
MPRFRLLLPLALLFLLTVAQPSQAFADIEVAGLPPESALQIGDEEEDETEVEVEGECAESEDEAVKSSEEAEEECEAEDAGLSPGEDCYLRTATAHVVAFPGRGLMRLTLGYTTYTPAAAKVEYGANKDPHLGTVQRRLGRSGVLRLSKHLADGQMAKVETSGRFTVTIHVPEAPQACQPFEVQRLRVAQSSRARVTWAEAR